VQTLTRIFNVFCLFLAVIWTCFCALLAMASALLKQDGAHWVHHRWGRVFCWLMGIRIECLGLEDLPRHAAVLAPNHESMYDILVMATLPINFKWVSKAQLGRVPFLGLGLKAMGSYFVRRDQSGHDLNIMREVEEGLRAGHSVLMFPEGTRTRTGELLPLKKGAFRTAQNAEVPLIPIAISGTYQIAPPGKFPTGRHHRVKIRFGKPFTVPPGPDITQSMENFRQELVSLLETLKH
jgi:1-acyl-sn-glycerol-3-phosphate acyltransferase